MQKISRENKHYQAIQRFYGQQTAQRSGLPLIAHIDEGLQILQLLKSDLRTQEAFCLHPLLQDDAALLQALQPGSDFAMLQAEPQVVILAMEYRAVANAYLSRHYRNENDLIGLSCLPEVQQMLIADKVQNRKDFEIYHLQQHPKRHILAAYFKNWLKRLNISEADYQRILQQLAA